jgi:hypothetical protein
MAAALLESLPAGLDSSRRGVPVAEKGVFLFSGRGERDGGARRNDWPIKKAQSHSDPDRQNPNKRNGGTARSSNHAAEQNAKTSTSNHENNRKRKHVRTLFNEGTVLGRNGAR